MCQHMAEIALLLHIERFKTLLEFHQQQAAKRQSLLFS